MTAVAAIAAISVLAGCSQVDTALEKQIAVVRFRAGTTMATLLQARQACSHVPNLPVLPPHVHPGNPTSAIALRYRADKASGHDLALLQTCLQKFPDVSGVTVTDAAGRGI